MDDIAKELNVIYGFNTTEDNATDTEAVSGEESKNIAIAAIGTNGFKDTEPRTTVRNALNLGGIPAEKYLTGESAEQIKDFASNVSTVYATEIASLREEFYELKGELMRNGIVEANNLYQGIYDTMNPNRPVCDLDSKGGIKYNVIAGDKKIYPELIDSFEVGDYFVIHQDALVTGDRPVDKVVQVIHKNKSIDINGVVVSDTGALVFEPDAGALSVSKTKLYKSLGQYREGVFSFTNTQDDVITNQEMFTMLNDDSNPPKVLKRIDVKDTGYATKFKVPKEVAGALSRFVIKVTSTVNSPGPLACYVIDADYIDSITSISEALKNKKVIAIASNFVHPTQETASDFTNVEFSNFKDAYGKPAILENKEYCFIVKALDVEKPDPITGSTGRYWTIMTTSKDVQTNNTFYKFEDKLDTVLAITPIADEDMYFVMATKKIVDQDTIAFMDGLYTVPVILPKAIEVSKARLLMRVGREGIFNITSMANKPYDKGTALDIRPDTTYSTYVGRNNGISIQEPFVIGKNIMSAKAILADKVTIDNGLYLEPLAPVYRVGYKINVRASLVKYVEVNGRTIRQETNVKYIPLDLTAVIPDGKYKADNKFSDRLVFEGLFVDNETPIYVNTFEFQIKWTSGFPDAELNGLNPYGQKNKELMGKISDLILSFDKTL
jgi:hypothetical protein